MFQRKKESARLREELQMEREERRKWWCFVGEMAAIAWEWSSWLVHIQSCTFLSLFVAIIRSLLVSCSVPKKLSLLPIKSLCSYEDLSEIWFIIGFHLEIAIWGRPSLGQTRNFGSDTVLPGSQSCLASPLSEVIPFIAGLHLWVMSTPFFHLGFE